MHNSILNKKVLLEEQSFVVDVKDNTIGYILPGKDEYICFESFNIPLSGIRAYNLEHNKSRLEKWFPLIGDLLAYKTGDKSFNVSPLKKIELNRYYLEDGFSFDSLSSVEPFLNQVPQFISEFK